MTITLLWWHMPALLTVLWAGLCFGHVPRGGSVFESINHGLGVVAGLMMVMIIWVLAVAWSLQ